MDGSGDKIGGKIAKWWMVVDKERLGGNATPPIYVLYFS
jgi:hypothetical protein